jgi:hypothetical protein
MKFVMLGAAMMAVAVPAVAQTTPAPVAPAPATTPAAKFTLDSPIETIIADPAGKAVIDKDLPGTTTHPMYDQFKTMSLNQVAPMAADKMTPVLMAKVQADLATVK